MISGQGFLRKRSKNWKYCTKLPIILLKRGVAP